MSPAPRRAARTAALFLATAAAATAAAPGAAEAYGRRVHELLIPLALEPGRDGLLEPVGAATPEELALFRAWLWQLLASTDDAALRERFLARWPSAESFDAGALKRFLALSAAARVHGIDLGGDATNRGALLADASQEPDSDGRNRERFQRDTSGQPLRDDWGRPLPEDPATLDMGSLLGLSSQAHAHYQLWPGERREDPALLKDEPWRFSKPAGAASFGAEFAQSYADMALLAELWEQPASPWLAASFQGAAFHHVADVANQLHTLQVGSRAYFVHAMKERAVDDLLSFGGVLRERMGFVPIGIRIVSNHHLFAEMLWAKWVAGEVGQDGAVRPGEEPLLRALRACHEDDRQFRGNLDAALSRGAERAHETDFAQRIVMELAAVGGPEGAQVYELAWALSTPRLKSRHTRFRDESDPGGGADDPESFLRPAGPESDRARADFVDVEARGLRRAASAMRLMLHLHRQSADSEGAAARVAARFLRARLDALDAAEARARDYVAKAPDSVERDLTIPLAALAALAILAGLVRFLFRRIRSRRGVSGPSAAILLVPGTLALATALSAASPRSAAASELPGLDFSPHQRALEAARGLPPFPASSVRGPSEAQLAARRARAQARDGEAPKVIGYLPYWMEPTNIAWDVVDVLVWFSTGVSATGSLGDDHGWGGAGADALIAAAHEAGAKVVLCGTRFGGNEVHALLSSATARQSAIENLVDAMQSGGGDGIDIDFEGLEVQDRDEMVTFVQDLRAEMEAAQPGSHLSLATPVVDWSGAWDYDVLAESSDALFIMGYAFHGSWGDPGPQAPLDGSSTWGTRSLRWSVQDYLEWGGVENADRFILGLPLYGYGWESVDGSVPGDVRDGGDAWAVFWAEAHEVADEHGRLWDEDSTSPYVLWQDGEGWNQLWYDDVQSITAKVQMASDEGIGGFGFWALEYDEGDPELWDSMSEQVANWGGEQAADDDDATAAGDDDATEAEGEPTPGADDDGGDSELEPPGDDVDGVAGEGGGMGCSGGASLAGLAAGAPPGALLCGLAALAGLQRRQGRPFRRAPAR